MWPENSFIFYFRRNWQCNRHWTSVSLFTQSSNFNSYTWIVNKRELSTFLNFSRGHWALFETWNSFNALFVASDSLLHSICFTIFRFSELFMHMGEMQRYNLVIPNTIFGCKFSYCRFLKLSHFIFHSKTINQFIRWLKVPKMKNLAQLALQEWKNKSINEIVNKNFNHINSNSIEPIECW